MGVTHDKEKVVAERHSLRIERPDLILSRPDGEILPEEAQIAWDIVREQMGQSEMLYWIADISRMHRYSAHMMQTMPEDFMPKLRAFAVVGGNFQQRTLISVGLRAGRLLYGWAKALEVEYFPDEPSARAWIDTLRAKHRA